MSDKKSEKQVSFEKALEKLEKLVTEMESGELSLEKMMNHFEEGTELVKYCEGKLNEVEQKIEVLVKKGEELRTEPLDAEDA